MAQLRFDIQPQGPDRVVIAVAGEIDLASAPDLTSCLSEHPDRDVVLDLSEVTFLDSSGISALVHAQQTLHASGHTLGTTSERDHVRKVLEIAGLADTLHGDADT
jgi:anti-sigma B factor antagonist